MDLFARFPTFQKGFWIRLALGNRRDIIVAGGSSVFAINIFGWVKFEHACNLTNMSPTLWQRRVCLEHLLCDMKRMLPKLLKIQFIFLQRQKLLRNTSMSSDRESLSLLVCSKCRESWKSWFISYHMYVLYFVNFIHTIKTSNLQFCVVIKSSLFWPKKTSIIGCVRVQVLSQVALRPECFLTSVCWYSHTLSLSFDDVWQCEFFWTILSWQKGY